LFFKEKSLVGLTPDFELLPDLPSFSKRTQLIFFKTELDTDLNSRLNLQYKEQKQYSKRYGYIQKILFFVQFLIWQKKSEKVKFKLKLQSF
jgi:hypothetical protein